MKVLNGHSGGNVDTKAVLGFLVGTGLLGLLGAFMVNTSKDASIAIQVAAQHGEELLIIRGELSALRQEMMERTRERFTTTDGRYLEQELRRIEQELDEHIKNTMDQ